MGFGYPLFLVALLAVAIPIIIHLFNFRRYKTIYFTNTKLLAAIKEQKNKISDLKDKILLFLRVMAVLFLVLAFAQPFLGKNNKGEYGNNAVAIYIDNSPSMGLKHKDQVMLDIAKARASEIVRAYTGTDRYMLLSNDMNGETNHWMSKQDVLSHIELLQLSSNSLMLSSITSRMNTILGDVATLGKKGYIISDFQKSAVSDIPKTAKDISIFWLPIQTKNSDNIYIDSCWMIDPVSNPNAAKRMAVRVVNTSDKEKENLRITLKVNNQAKSINEIDIAARSKRVDTFSYNGNGMGWQDGMFLFDDYPITFDDKFYFTQKANITYKVLTVEDATSSSAIFAIFNGDPAIQIFRNPSSSVDFSALLQYQLVILNEVSAISSGMITALGKYLEQGGSLYIIPPATGDNSSINALLMSIDAGRLGELTSYDGEVSQLNMQEDVIHTIFETSPKNLDLPKVKQYFPILSSSRSNERMLMRMHNGASVLSKFYTKGGITYLSALPLSRSYSDIVQKAVFPAIVYNFAFFIQGKDNLYYTLGDDLPLVIDGNYSQTEQQIKVKSQHSEFVPYMRPQGQQSLLFVSQGISTAGNYDIVQDEALIKKVAYNYNAKESEMLFLSMSEIKKMANTLQVNIVNNAGIVSSSYGSGNIKNLWKLFLILTLLALVAEMSVQKWLK
jgi:hypothetical protein